MIDLLLGPLGGILAGVGAALLAWLFGRHQGARAENDKHVRKDHENADKVRTAADRARAADDAGAEPLDGLHRAGRLRD